MWTTWANLLTLVRLLVAAPCALAVWREHWSIAAMLLSVAIITDLADGPVARRFSHETPLGGLLDHATDAVFIALVLTALAMNGQINMLLPIFVAGAFLQYTLDSRALRGHRLRSSGLGRSNGIAYFVVGSIPVFGHALSLEGLVQPLTGVLAWVLVLTTLISMAERLWVWLGTR
jgi:phosphatidylglycerophosphate synthase